MNGKKHGEGKEYNNKGKLIFKGEYLYGKIWNGKLRNYLFNGELEFEKVFLNGELSQIKKYNYNGH